MVAVLSGHLHRGGYAVDGSGVHHVTLNSPLSHEDCFGYIAVFDDRLELVGSGDMKSRTLPFPGICEMPSGGGAMGRLDKDA